jgi:hypothetical protein
MRVADRGGRWARLVAYFGFAFAAVVLLDQIDDTPGINIVLWYVMSGFLLGGSLPAALGQLTGRWTGEFVGLPLVASALFGFGILTGGANGWAYQAVPSIVLLWAFALLIWSRWRSVHVMYGAAMQGAKR